MKALVCSEFGSTQNLRLEDAEAPEPSAGQVLIDVHAAGVNFPDILTVQGKYQFKPNLPFTPGTEVSGVVTKVGEGVVEIKGKKLMLSFSEYGVLNNTSRFA